MDHLPLEDTPMLVSCINFLLRDGICKDLDDVCAVYGVDKDEITKKLDSGGYKYFPEQNAIR